MKPCKKGGSSVAIAHAAGAKLEVGLAGAFLVGLVATLVLLVVARRLPAGAVGPRA